MNIRPQILKWAKPCLLFMLLFCMVIGKQEKVFASDNLDGYKFSYIFGEYAISSRRTCAQTYVPNLYRTYHACGSQECTSRYEGSFSYDCGYKLYLPTNCGRFNAPGGLSNSTARQLNGRPYTITGANAGDWTGQAWQSGSDTNVYYTYHVTVNHIQSSWGADGNYHRTYCTSCGGWMQSHNKDTNYYWITDGSAHKKHCNIDGLEFDSGNHYDNDANGFCDACGRDIQIPKVTRGTYVKDNTGIWVYSYVQDNSGNVPYTRWWVWNTQDNNWRYFDYQNTEIGDFWIGGIQYNRRFRVNISSYANSTGPYHVDCRAYDAAGLCSDAGIDNSTNFLRMCTNVYIDTTPPVIERATYEADSSGYWVYSYVTDNENLSKVAYPSWTALNGQDDLKANWWDTMVGTKGSWTINGQVYNNRYRIDKSTHNNESGPYITHVYAYDASGNYTVLGINNIYLKYLVTYIDISISDGENGIELGKTKKYVNYNSTVSGADIGNDTSKSKYYNNYEYVDCTSATVTDQGAVVYRKFRLSTVAITFHNQNGTGGPGAVSWLIGSVQRPSSPIRGGYNFAGWNTSENGSGMFWPATDIVPSNIHDYYAQWIPNMYTSVQER